MYKVYLVMRHDGDTTQPVAVFPNKSSAEGFARGDASLYVIPVPYHDDEV